MHMTAIYEENECKLRANVKGKKVSAIKTKKPRCSATHPHCEICKQIPGGAVTPTRMNECLLFDELWVVM